MKLNKIIQFCKTNAKVLFVGVALVLGIAFLFWFLGSQEKESSGLKKNDKSAYKVENENIAIKTNMEPVIGDEEKGKKKKDEKIEFETPGGENKSSAVAPPGPPTAGSGQGGNKKPRERTEKNDATIYVAKKEANSFVPERYAPYGRLIHCKLTNTIESTNTNTPIIGYTTEDLYQINGHGVSELIIPAGVQVYGTAKSSSMRDRIYSGNSWILVWRLGEMNGYELELEGVALEKSEQPNKPGHYALTDMTAGIPGEIIENEGFKKMFAALAAGVKSASDALSQNDTYISNNTVVSTAPRDRQTAAAGFMEGLSAEIYKDMSRQIANNTFFVRVPAGTEFYLHVQEVIDIKKARIANSLLSKQEKEEREAANPQRYQQQRYFGSQSQAAGPANQNMSMNQQGMK